MIYPLTDVNKIFFFFIYSIDRNLQSEKKSTGTLRKKDMEARKRNEEVGQNPRDSFF